MGPKFFTPLATLLSYLFPSHSVLPKCKINIEKHVFYGPFASKFLNIWFHLLAIILYSYVRPNFSKFTICWTDKKESYLEVGNTEKPHLSPPTPV
jgi:hypothetical protein